MLDPLKKPDCVIVGVLSDTHLPYRLQRLPDKIFHIFRDVDIILHAGDVDRIEYLSDLSRLAPLHAVRGNPHLRDMSDGGRDLPVELQLNIAGYQVVVNHGGWPGFWSQAGDWLTQHVFKLDNDGLNRRIANRLAQRYPRADIILFGHIHRAYQAWHNSTLVFNPGAVCPTQREIQSLGKLYLRPNTIEVEVIPFV